MDSALMSGERCSTTAAVGSIANAGADGFAAASSTLGSDGADRSLSALASAVTSSSAPAGHSGSMRRVDQQSGVADRSSTPSGLLGSMRRVDLPLSTPMKDPGASPLNVSASASVREPSVGGTPLALADGGSRSPSLNARVRFEKLVRRHYYQLTFGCQDTSCTHKLCASCPTGPRLAPQAAAVMAVQLASRPRHFICPRIPLEPNISLSDVPINLSTRQGTPTGSPSASPKLSGRIAVAMTGGSASSANQSLPPSSVSAGDPTWPPPQDGSPVDRTSSTPSKPFLFSLLSSSPFSSLFRPADEGSPAKPSETHPLSSSLPPSMSRTSAVSAPKKETLRQDSTVQPTASPSSYLSLKALGRIGSDAIGKSKSLLDLPSLLSASIGFSSLSSREGSPSNDGNRVSDSEDSRPPSPGKRRDVLNESSPLSSPALIPVKHEDDEVPWLESLTLPMIQKAVDAYVASSKARSSPSWVDLYGIFSHNSDQAHLISMIRGGFSSSDVLNQSYLIDPAIASSPDRLNLDVAAVRAAYKIILDLEPKEVFHRTLLNASEIALAMIQLNAKRLHSGNAASLHQFIILLESPLLEDSKYREGILKKLCLVLGSLRSKSKQTLGSWLSRYETSDFRRIVQIFQTYVSEHFSNGMKADDVMISAVRVLSLLYNANESMAPAHRLAIASFYNDALNRKLNFKEEYRNWKKTLEKSPKVVDFSYFNYPFLFDPVAKTRVMHIDAMVQMSQEFEEAVVHQAIVIHAQRFLQDSPSIANLEQELKGATNPFFVLEVRRQHLVKDVLDQIRRKEKDMKKPLKVKFIGGGEEGMDQGGVQKEFFQVLVNLLFDPAYGMFTYEDDTRYCWINRASLESERQFELVGIVLGLALYNGVILGINFPPLMYKKLLDEEVTLEDVKVAFPSLGRGLQLLLDWTDGSVADVFMRSFEISYDVYGQVKTFPLVQNGDNIPVTNDNRGEYVDMYIKHYVNESVQRQFNAFRRGFHRVCGGKAVKMCRAEELELLLCGTADLDFSDLENGADYDDSYHAEHPFIRQFWSIVHEMTYDQKKKLLMFVTASDRVPLKGLGNLTFVVQRNGPDTGRLPTALTCFGRLLLPEYSTQEKLKERLITAIENAKGFGLV
ncbi:hypothetical protein DFJ73DRAFT_841034 [Zopfochytrium polystomum]|nr:hypothetical protein DFJ73DRAFT_841034 [Zopfochytrium polystomum]